MLVLWAGGCASVYPQAHPAQPVAVYLADYGIHSSLIIPNGDGRFVEYAYGDWNYAALNHDWPNDALGALLISFKSTLGRRFIEPAPGETAPHPLHPAPKTLQLVYNPREGVERVRNELDERYRRDATIVVHNPENDMDFVPDHMHYSFWNNCNDLTAHCLRGMGCEIRGVVGFSKFFVAKNQPDVVPETDSPGSLAGALPTARAN
ncbi:MAG TPA: hypothetical protein VIM11_19465 [Tepidisphaeraceae bacterium]